MVRWNLAWLIVIPVCVVCVMLDFIRVNLEMNRFKLNHFDDFSGKIIIADLETIQGVLKPLEGYVT